MPSIKVDNQNQIGILCEFDYQRLMRSHHGDINKASEAMTKSFRLYYPNRENYIARKRAKSCIRILRVLKSRAAKRADKP